MDKCLSICSVRNAVPADLPFYASMFIDEEWLGSTGYRFLDFNTPQKLLKFITPQCSKDIKWVVKLTQTNKMIGFCHFKKKPQGYAETDGGIIKMLMNSPTSIICYIYCIDKYFNLGISQELHSIIYGENKRSLKMNLALGFKPIGHLFYDSRLFYKAVLTKQSFYSSTIAKRFLK